MARILLGLALACIAAPAWAQTAQEVDWCYSPTATDDETIAGCTAIITAGNKTPNAMNEAYYNRGFGYSNKDMHDPAIADFTEALMIHNNDIMSLNARGRQYYLKGLYDQALIDENNAISIDQTDASSAVNLDKNRARSYAQRGLIYKALGRRDEAIADFRRALSLDPTNTTATRELAQLGVTP